MKLLILLMITFAGTNSLYAARFKLRGVVKRNMSLDYDSRGRVVIRKNSSIPLKVIRSEKSFSILDFTVHKRVTKTKIKKDFELITLQTI